MQYSNQNLSPIFRATEEVVHEALNEINEIFMLKKLCMSLARGRVQFHVGAAEHQRYAWIEITKVANFHALYDFSSCKMY